MPRKVPWPPPIYRRGDRDVVRIRTGPRKCREITLGPAGSEESRAEYGRIVAEMTAHGRTLDTPADVTVAELARDWLRAMKAEQEPRTYRRYVRAMRGVCALYGRKPAVEFGPLALATVRDGWAKEGGLSRQYINHLVNAVRSAWRWAVAAEMIPSPRADALSMLKPARRGKTPAPEAPKVRPADLAMVDATLPHLPAAVADMVRVELLTGMRPGEVCALQPADFVRAWKVIDGVEVWLARFDEHKNEWRGHYRWVPIGPKAQAVLAPYLERPVGGYCFCPREVAEAAARARGRRLNVNHARPPGECYETERYDRCVQRACRRAFPPPAHLARKTGVGRGGKEPVAKWHARLGEKGLAELKAWEAAHSWRPNQLRHSRATEIETLYGREDARCVLGHRTPTTTAIYAESVDRAAKVMAKIG